MGTVPIPQASPFERPAGALAESPTLIESSLAENVYGT
jgi:hypothetical protein